VRFPLEPVARRAGAAFLNTSVERVDPLRNLVHLAGGSTLEYDQLLITVGARKDYDAIPGFREHGYSVCDDFEATRMARAVEAFRGGTITVGSARSEWGTRVAVPHLAAPCEGPVGEVVFMLDHELRRRGIRDQTRLRVFSPGERFFEDVGPRVHAALAPHFERRRIEITPSRVLRAIHAGEVEFAGGDRWPSDLTVIIPPYTGKPFVAASDGLGDERGFIPTDTRMRHLDFPDIFAAGDGTALSMPKLGHIAIHQADIASAALRRKLTGEGEIPPFEPEIFCIMNQGGPEATIILSNHLFGGDIDTAVSSPLARLMQWGFDSYYFHTRGHLSPDLAEEVLLDLLRSSERSADPEPPRPAGHGDQPE